MSKFVIHGGKRLKGEIHVSGSKNAALPMLAASLMTAGTTTLTRVPAIEDIARMVEIMRDLGVDVAVRDQEQYIITAHEIKTSKLSRDLAPKIRASLLFLGPLLYRTGEVTLPHPGGCALGKRSYDFFVNGFRKFGAAVHEGDDELIFKCKKFHPARFVFPKVSHTATEALMMVAAVTPGESELVNAAMEPEVMALAEHLSHAGARIAGAGTPTIKIFGVPELRAVQTEMIPDRIEAGTFAALAAATKSDLWIRGCNTAHLDVPLLMLERIGVKIEVLPDAIHVRPSSRIEAKDLTTREYPGFPTDLQPPFTVLLTQAKGVSLVHETIFDGRLFYTEKLNKMGANITLSDAHRAVVEGPTPLHGSTQESPDLRAGLALIIAALAAKGKSTIGNAYQIDRGYEKIEERLRAIGAEIERVV